MEKNIGYKLLSEPDSIVYVPAFAYSVVKDVIDNMFSNNPEPIWEDVLKAKYKDYPHITPPKESMKDRLYLIYFLLMNNEPEFFGVKFEAGQSEVISTKLKGIEDKLKKMNDEAWEKK